jgi:hypothetical protein
LAFHGEFFTNGGNDFSKKTEDAHISMNRLCGVCGEAMLVTVRVDGSYCGGEYFGKMPELAIRKRPAGYEPAVAEEIWRHSDEYWECPDCCSN